MTMSRTTISAMTMLEDNTVESSIRTLSDVLTNLVAERAKKGTESHRVDSVA